MRHHDMAELGTADRHPTRVVRALHVGQLPLVDAPELRGADDFDGVAAPEARALLSLREGHLDPLAGDRVAHEHHPALMSADAVPAVGNRADVELDPTLELDGLGLGLGDRHEHSFRHRARTRSSAGA